MLVTALGETPCPCASLIDATAEPPRHPEAEVVSGRGWCLAMAIETGRREDGTRIYGWALTGTGCQWVEREANGQIARAS